MYYPDLGTSSPIASGPRVRAIGWLASGHDFPKGQPDPRFANALSAHLNDGWRHAAIAMPPLACTFCKPIPGVEGESEYILVPADELLFVAPSMILHSMIAHDYAPPPAFCAAVLACAAVSTDAYYAALGRFLDVFGPEHLLSREEFERSTREHRDRVTAVRAARAARAPGKRRPPE